MNPTPCKKSLLFLLLDQGGEPHILQEEPAFSSSCSRRWTPHPARRACFFFFLIEEVNPTSCKKSLLFLLLDREGERHTLQEEPAFSSSWSRRRNGSYAKVVSIEHLKCLPTPDKLTKCSDNNCTCIFFLIKIERTLFHWGGIKYILYKSYLLALFVVPVVSRCIFLLITIRVHLLKKTKTFS